MKRPLIILLSSAIALAFGACNKHSWDEEIDGRIVQQTKVFHKGRVFVFTGEGTTFDKVLGSVKLIE